MKLSAAFLITTISFPALAGTFCLGGTGLPPQCIYEDVRDCQHVARGQSQTCIISPDAALSYVGSERYCAVGSERVADCLFVDRNRCNEEARRGSRVCFDRQIINDPDNPFKYDQRLQY